MGNGPECLQFHFLSRELRQLSQSIPDFRTGMQKRFPLADVIMSGIAMMFWQDPGLLPFQQRLQEHHGTSNLGTMFQVNQVPKETQFRKLLDSIDPSHLLLGLRQLISLLQKTRLWNGFRFLDGRYVVALDGTEFFHSEKVRCPHCLERRHRDGKVEFYHQAFVAALIHPVSGEAFPLWAEEIRREDGSTKQDCEINAARRLLPVLAKTYSHMDIVLVADSLYSKSPMIDLCRALHLNFIFVAQPGDHGHLLEQLQGLRLADGITILAKESQGKIGKRQIEIAHDVPLFSTTDAVAHWLGYREWGKTSEKGYQNGWIASIKPTARNALELVSAGRHRSSIENQTFNALKNHGYHLEHNFGHGQMNLRFNFVILNLLAFLMHQLLSLGDEFYAEAKVWKRTVREFYEYLRFALRLALWPDWATLMKAYMDKGPRIRVEGG